MHVIAARNIRDAFYYAIQRTAEFGELQDTRIGPAYVIQEPVTITYEYPKQHVLLDKWRDANPFFHLMEAMWMLAGRQDSAFLDNYVHDFGKRFSVDGIVPDAYGYRWKYGLAFNQIAEIIDQLKISPNTRQAVLQMWGAGKDDLLTTGPKPCNLVACFMIRDKRLDMTVYNRSNDLVWGACGANAVHFPIMQEYVAAMVGVELGCYWQVTNNLHMYKDQYEKLYPHIKSIFNGHLLKYEQTQRLVDMPDYFYKDLKYTMIYLDALHNGVSDISFLGDMNNSFLLHVVAPMARAYRLFRNKDIPAAINQMSFVTAEDWRVAGTEWLQRRIK